MGHKDGGTPHRACTLVGVLPRALLKSRSEPGLAHDPRQRQAFRLIQGSGGDVLLASGSNHLRQGSEIEADARGDLWFLLAGQHRGSLEPG